MFEDLGICAVEKRLLKYIPKQLRPYVVWLDSEKVGNHQWTYFLTVEKDGVEMSAEPCDSVSELTWEAKSLLKYVTGEKKWDPAWR